MPFFTRYQEFLSWGNSNGSRTTPKSFSKFFFSTNMVTRGVQSFCILEGAADPLIDQLQKFFVNLAQTYDEQMLKISSQYLKWLQIYCHLTEKFWQLPAYSHTK